MANNDNVEGSGAKNLSGSGSNGKGRILDYIANNFLYNNRSSNSDSSTSSKSSKGKTGNGWTAEDYKNYGDWQERHYGLHNDSEDKKVYREGKALEHRTDMQDVAKNRDLKREIQRKRLGPTGYGPGGQGGSQQQSKPGGRGAAIGKAAGAVIGGATTKTSTGAATGAKFGEKIGAAIDKKVANRTPKVKPTSADLTTTTVKPRGKKA